MNDVASGLCCRRSADLGRVARFDVDPTAKKARLRFLFREFGFWGRGQWSVCDRERMRLQRSVDVAGIEPGLAREAARACRVDWTSAEYVAERLHLPLDEAVAVLGRLEQEGFLERSEQKWGGKPTPVWTTTVSGGALAQASFLKPITREKAESLLAGVVERATIYNDDPERPLWIERITLFGSLLDGDATDFGDVDLQLVHATRPSPDEHVKLTYANSSGRSFPTFLDKLFWAEKEMRQILKNRSPYISLTDEDISRITDGSKVVYERTP